MLPKPCRDIVAALSQHASAEEQTLYLLARDKILIGQESGRKSMFLFNGLLIDNQATELQWNYLKISMPETDEEWNLFDRQVDLVATMEEMHIGKEEEEVLGRLRETLSNQEKGQLWIKWTEALGRAPPLQPHPGLPSTSVLASVLHPLAGVGDRASEAVGGLLQRLHITGTHPAGPDTASTEVDPRLRAKAEEAEKKATVQKDATLPGELLQG
ncbi:hypothetical protein DUNSADRAFT_14755 [Dunaliella salina]|uniref:Uncharacterized protein n=1 Tax=Dunaliella salina TaxID=3046 RepID=A0ABQ7G6W9_DUNSA|nr:hypothetical protein DUNSADRAFT_14755 [Dunaliella salina]|eukprot:KAF5830324.1 hypothetical protein DUNSADRAFT_14755 [Dunaliella salina]